MQTNIYCVGCSFFKIVWKKLWKSEVRTDNVGKICSLKSFSRTKDKKRRKEIIDFCSLANFMNENFSGHLREGEFECLYDIGWNICNSLWNRVLVEVKLKNLVETKSFTSTLKVKWTLSHFFPKITVCVRETKRNKTKVMHSGLYRTLWFISAIRRREKKERKSYVISIVAFKETRWTKERNRKYCDLISEKKIIARPEWKLSRWLWLELLRWDVQDQGRRTA